MTERKRLRDIELLTQSIAHWKRMQADPRNCREKPTSYYCALCSKYWHYIDLQCAGCPIFEHTGKSGCKETPWTAAFEAWKMAKRRRATFGAIMVWTAAAQAEIDFLKMIKTKLEQQS